MADYPVATPEQIAEAQRLAAAAEAANRAWRTNTAPVLPKMGTPSGVPVNDQDLTRIYIGGDANTPGVARDVTRSEYIQMYGRTPEQSEAQKYYSFNAPIDYAAYANVPLSQLPENIASRVQDYLAAHPTARYQAITQQYAAARGGAGAAANPFDPDTAAGIAWEVARVSGTGKYGGGVTESLKEKAMFEISPGMSPLGGTGYGGYSAADRLRGEKMVAGLTTISGMETVPVRDQYAYAQIAPGRDVLVPLGEYAQQLRTDAKLIVAESGAYSVWQTPKNTMPGSDFVRIYPMITAGGSDYALQSGMITGKAATPQVYSEYGLQPLWKESAAARVADIQAHPEQYSRLGSELYGGIVQKLLPEPYNAIEVAWARGQTVEPGVYPAVRENYASLVNFADVNAPKGTVSSGANLPKFGTISPQQFTEMPALQRVDLEGGLYPAVMKETAPATPYKSVSRPEDTFAKSEGSSYDIYREVRAAIPSNPIFDIAAEVGVWAGAVTPMARGISGVPETVINIQKNLFLDTAKDKSYSGAIAHAQAHETGYFSPEQTIIGDVGTNKLLSVQRGGFGYTNVELPSVPTGTQLGVSHTHPEPFPLLNLIPGGYFATASPTDVSQLAAERRAGIVESSVITKGSVLTYQLPESGTEATLAAATYKSESTGWPQGLFGLKEQSQKEFFESAGAPFRTEQIYRPSGATPSSGVSGAATFMKSKVTAPEATVSPLEQNVGELKQKLTKSPTDVYFSGGMIGEYFFGEKSPKVVQGFVGSVVDFATGVATLGQWQPAKEALQTTTPEGKVYEYGEYTKAGASLGAKFRETTGGYSEAQLEAYGTTLEAKPVGVGPWYDPLRDVRERIVFGTGKVVATHPEKIATAYGGGGALVVGGGIIGGTVEEVGAGTGLTALAARTAVTGGRYILPAVFTAAMGYSVTEGGTATPSKTFVNVGEMFPEAAGAALGGGSTYLLAGRNLPIGFKTEKEPTTYIFAEDIPAGVKSVRDIRKSPLGDIGLPPKQYEVAPTEFSMKTGTEVMDIGYVLTGRKAGALPTGVVEGLKSPAPLTRGIQLEYMEPGLPGVGGVLTGAPKATRPMTPAEAAFGLKLSVEPVGAATPKGLETRFGSGTGISGKGLQQIVNPEIAPLVQKTTYGTSIESNIIAETTKARVSPAVQAAEAQRIVPSATTKTFEKPVSLGSKVFEETLFGIVESEKRTTSMKGKLPRGMQIDYLRDALKTRAPITLNAPKKVQPEGKTLRVYRGEPIEYFNRDVSEVAFETKGKWFTTDIKYAQERAIGGGLSFGRVKPPNQIKPGHVVYVDIPLNELEKYGLSQHGGSTDIIIPRDLVLTKQPLPRQKQVPVQIQPQIQPPVQPPITNQPQKQVQPPVQRQPQVQQPSQKQTPYVVPVQVPTQAPTTYQKQTPYVPPVFPTTPTFPTPGTPSTPQRTPPTYVPPIFPGVPTFPPATTTTKPPTTKPPTTPPITPVVGGFLWPGGASGATTGRFPRRAAFMETFMMGLDVGFGMGGRRPRAKSFTTPKKYKAKPATVKKAKKKVGKR